MGRNPRENYDRYAENNSRGGSGGYYDARSGMAKRRTADGGRNSAGDQGYDGQRYVNSVYTDSGYMNPGYPDQRNTYQRNVYQKNADQRYTDQRYTDQRYAEQRYADADYHDQRHVRQRNVNSGYRNRQYDGQRYENSGYQDQRYADSGYPAQQYNDQRYADQRNADAGYADQRYTEPGLADKKRTRTNAGTRSGNTRNRSANAGTGRNAADVRRNTAERSEANVYRTRQKNNTRKTGNIQKKRRPGTKKTALFLCLILVLLLIAGCACGGWYLYQKGQKPSAPEVTVSIDSLDSPYAILIDRETGNVLSSKNGDEIIYPASMAKIMTVLTAIDHIENLNRTVTMSYDYYETLYAQDASRAGFEPGEEAVIRDLLYGALLPSGAECCMELAIQAAGSEEAFAELMNQKAAELGLTQTHFTNCTGLHNENQYSTPHEIAKILQAALKNKTFREVFTTHSYSVQPTNVHPDGFTFWSSMFKNMQAETVIGGEIMGGKTGFTQAAGYCLASMAEVEEREYILVTAGWAANPRTAQYHINDAFLGYNALGRALAEAREG